MFFDFGIFITSGLSFSDKFFTAIRLSRTVDVTVKVMKQDIAGNDPPPACLKSAREKQGDFL
ncbi:uncharacterized protein K489DRAFT_383933 [Dissoconium aciculare CBS 342.82]|uniref:Uncharacterized protein n=1 Tax=Dissoconium aciculare CBS 342.82 TaxID=1314786 RepID=A0A6J3LTT6_9PEZI|nr:uncharacterized protein K489DRAFT_383933 [Dissoconium aciculare CBS 342.82]KAF1819043.1 hypothetical protein K489DRAFT_383933 [Dissoconium aciculare CBS 342.82]